MYIENRSSGVSQSIHRWIMSIAQREWILKLWGNILKKKEKDKEREGGVKEKEERKARRERKN